MDQPALALSEGQREQMKLTAAYLNGLAIGVALVGGISLPATVAVNAQSVLELILALSLSLFSFVTSPYIHRMAKNSLRRLDA